MNEIEFSTESANDEEDDVEVEYYQDTNITEVTRQSLNTSPTELGNSSEIQGAFGETVAESQGFMLPENTEKITDSFYSNFIDKISKLPNTCRKNFKILSPSEMNAFIGILEYQYKKYIVIFISKEPNYYSSLIQEYLSREAILIEKEENNIQMLDIRECLDLKDMVFYENLALEELSTLLISEKFLCLEGVFTKRFN